MTKNNAREQIIAKLKDAQNVLITVSNNPSVDELAAALALTLAINKADKHATAVASGKMPDALEFLNPNKTFETSVDSLRDFIIALNKEKADHLRYKLVGDHVKIFITPYRNTITEKDLEFEQGDFNVDMVLALGVSNKDHLDGALAAHGRIFHDASVGVLTVGETSSDLSDLNWHNEQASSLSEMVLELIESDSIGKKSLNKSVATAILTGIVAETDRFSNEKTSAKVMNLASKLIMSGADQQLVISKLREAEEKQAEISLRNDIEEQSSNLEKIEAPQAEAKIETPTKDASVLTIERDEPADEEDELEKSLNAMSSANETNAFEELETEKTPEQIQAEQLAVDFPAAHNPEPETPELAFEETEPIETAQIPNEETAPAPQVEISAPSFENAPASNEAPQVVAPIENFAPEIPAPESSQQNAFISEQPVEAVEFAPAPQVEISAPSFENAPVSNESPQPTFGAREYVGDDYYNPERAQQLAQNLSNASIHDVNANDAPVSTPDVSSHGIDLTPPTLGVSAANNTANFDDQTFEAPQQTFENPTTEFNAPAQNFGGFPPPVPDFGAMPLPPELPPVPNFSDVDFNAMPAPTPIVGEQEFNFEPAQTVPDVAQGISTSTNNIITDQIYQDPAQFKIPGM